MGARQKKEKDNGERNGVERKRWRSQSTLLLFHSFASKQQSITDGNTYLQMQVIDPVLTEKKKD